MKHRPWFSILGFFALASCADEVSLPGRPCPCADGWTCCQGRNVCVPSDQFCLPAQQTKSCPCDDGFTCCMGNNSCIPTGQSCAVPTDPEITHHPSRGVRVPCAETETDYSQPDGSPVSVEWTYVHDVWGNITEMLGDRGLDGTIDLDSRWFYDIYGNLTSREEYDDGNLRYKRNASYDQYGRPTTREVDSDGDGLIDQRDTWDYHGPQPIRTTQYFKMATPTSTLRCTYLVRPDGQPTSYNCLALPMETQAERADYSDAADRRIILIASNGVDVDHEVDIIRAVGLIEIDEYSVTMTARQRVRHFVIDALNGTPSMWDLNDTTRMDFPHSTGTYKYVCK
jgi:hypothetical protein